MEVLALAGVLGLVLVLLGWWARPGARDIEPLRKRLGGHIEGAILILDDGMSLRRRRMGGLEATLRVKARGSVSVRATGSGLRRVGDTNLLAEGAAQDIAGVGQFVLTDNTLVVTSNGGPELAFVERARAIARGLEWSWLGPWQRVGRARGLRLEDQELEGHIDGIEVEVEVQGGSTVIVAEAPLRQLSAVHKDLAEQLPEARPTGLPVLDLCVAVATSEPVEEELVETLLKVVHAWPGSSVSPRGVRLVIPGVVTEGLGERIDEAVALARALRS